MMQSKTSLHTTFLYKVMWLLIPPNILLYLWEMVDYVMHPLATAMYGPAEFASPPGRALFVLVVSPIMLVLGILILRRAAGNVIGVLVTLLGLGFPYFAVGPHTHPLLAALQSCMIPIFWISLIYMVLLFPDGRAYPRWAERWLTAIMLYTFVTGVLSGVSMPSLSTFGPPVPNLLYVPALVKVYALFTSGSLVTLLPIALGIFITPILRYRAVPPGSREREQIKWLALCACVFAVLLVGYVISTQAADVNSSAVRAFRLVYFPFVVIFPPLTLGLAIVRHKLYDIDIIIRRTLVYSLLTAILGAVYIGSVVVLQTVLEPLVGTNGQLATVASTLAIAALFQPLRRSIQRVIDRRFFRRKYDAAKTLQAFSARLRDETDLQMITDDMVRVVEETLQPAHVSIWLREPKDGRGVLP